MVVLVHPGHLQWLSELWHSQHVPWCCHVTHPSQGSGKTHNRMKWVSWRTASSGTQSLKSSFSEHSGQQLQSPAPLSLWQCRPLCATASNFVGNYRDLDCAQFVWLVGDTSKILLNAMMVRVSVSQRLFSWIHQGQTFPAHCWSHSLSTGMSTKWPKSHMSSSECSCEQHERVSSMPATQLRKDPFQRHSRTMKCCGS